MPIRPEMLRLYPRDWPQISRKVRFERAGGVCQGGGRPHGLTVRCLPDGRWFDATCRTWRNGRGRPAHWPDLVETVHVRQTHVILAAAHLDHNPRNNRQRNLKSLCQRCHMIHDRPHHLAQRRITCLLRRAWQSVSRSLLNLRRNSKAGAGGHAINRARGNRKKAVDRKAAVRDVFARHLRSDAA